LAVNPLSTSSIPLKQKNGWTYDQHPLSSFLYAIRRAMVVFE
jgi:hypothetical protein